MRAPIAATTAFLGLALLGSSFAFAQPGGSSGSSSGLSAPANPSVPPSLGSGGTQQAPVGHFQPRRDSVPDEKSTYVESPEEKALDRKIKSICRGC